MCVLARRIAVLAVTVVVAVTAKFQSPPPSRHLNDPPPLPTSVNIKVDGVLMRSTGTPVPTTTVVTAAMGVLASSDEKMVPGEPHFDYSLPTEISAVVGKAAYLSCRVKNAGNWTISWMRVTDMHILTAGAYTYTSDQRYATNYIESTGEWVLTIKWTQEGDSGRYDCQTSTMPIRSFTVLLHVIVTIRSVQPELRRVPRDAQTEDLLNVNSTDCVFVKTPFPRFLNPYPMNVTVKAGMRVYLNCRIMDNGTYVVSWLRYSNMEILAVRKNIFIHDDRFRVLAGNGWVTLVIDPVRKTDEGIYMCEVNTETFSFSLIDLKVLDSLAGDKPQVENDVLADAVQSFSDPNITITGEKNITVHEGERLVLTCILETVNVIFPNWSMNGVQLDQTNHNFFLKLYPNYDQQVMISELTMKNVTVNDTGTYACRWMNASVVDYVNVTVIRDAGGHLVWILGPILTGSFLLVALF